MSSLSSFASLLSSSTGIGGAKSAIQPTTGRIDRPLTAAEKAIPRSFSKRIRAETAQSHRITESTSFVKAILRGAVDIESYRNMQTGLYFIYSAMEEELERHSLHPLVRRVYFSALSRCSALEQDLDFLWDEAWRERLHITPARQEYVDRIRWVGENDPDLLVAHSYTRYMGDLSGGQVVERVIRRCLKIHGEDGFRFFHFDDIDDVKAFKNTYRRRLDGLLISQSQAEKIIGESNRVFDLNRQFFEELEGSWVRTLGKLLPAGFSQRRAAGH